MRRYLLVTLSILALTALCVYVAKQSSVRESVIEYPDLSAITHSYSESLQLGGYSFKTEIADNNDSRRRGLSDTVSLCEDCAMLFVFESEGVYPFWMKGMNYDLDIIYLDKDKRVVDVFTNVQKESYPARTTNRVSAQYVLEINSGLSSKLNIKVGDVAKF